ncbi:hypothetical protein IMZ11_32130 [Microtetraspora sp. AC03309]|uniref:DUF3040 domain-containing protein n=1 Tax=Microtetraspora sp. AC03309 TaxID=2779376 RepID=UPI001E4378A3|nr:DUF3040 domain-containing protein [Microtetraspora sp. AC03309]MCC5580280.1 hypothetical protein [Microtetraspora sp. AC03309]
MNAPRLAWPARVLALCFALGAAVFPGFGTVDLAVPIVAPSPSFIQAAVLEGGWGLVLSLLVAVPFLVIFLNPAARAAALGEVVVVGAVIGLTGVLSGRPEFLTVTAALGLCAGLLAAMLRGWTTTGRPRAWHLVLAAVPFAGAATALVLGAAASAAWLGVVGAVVTLAVVLSRWGAVPDSRSRLPLVLATAAALPWTWYAADMIGAASEGREPIDITMGLDHWPMQAALGITLIALAAWGHPIPATTSGIASMGFGALAMAYPDHAASPGTIWGVAALVWGLTVLSWGLLRRGAARHQDATRDRKETPLTTRR